MPPNATGSTTERHCLHNRCIGGKGDAQD